MSFPASYTWQSSAIGHEGSTAARPFTTSFTCCCRDFRCGTLRSVCARGYIVGSGGNAVVAPLLLHELLLWRLPTYLTSQEASAVVLAAVRVVVIVYTWHATARVCELLLWRLPRRRAIAKRGTHEIYAHIDATRRHHPPAILGRCLTSPAPETSRRILSAIGG